MRIKPLILGLLAVFIASASYAQSIPNGGNITDGQVWTTPQWRNAWMSKLDTAATGTSGHSIPFLDTQNSWSNTQTFNSIVASMTGGTIDNSSIGLSTPATSKFTSTVIGSPSGGNEGSGTLNAEVLYQNGSQVLTQSPWASVSLSSSTLDLCNTTTQNLLVTNPGGSPQTITSFGNCASGIRRLIKNAGSITIPIIQDGSLIKGYNPGGTGFTPQLSLQPEETIEAVSLGGGSYQLSNYSAQAIWNFTQVPTNGCGSTAYPSCSWVGFGAPQGGGPVPFLPFAANWNAGGAKIYSGGARWMLPGDTPNEQFRCADQDVATLGPKPWAAAGLCGHIAGIPIIDIGPDASVTGSISTGPQGTGTFNVTAIGSGSLAPGQIISGSGITPGTWIVGQNSGVSGGIGGYAVYPSQTASSTTVTAKLYNFPNNGTPSWVGLGGSPSYAFQGFSGDIQFIHTQAPSLAGTGGAIAFGVTPNNYGTHFLRASISNRGNIIAGGQAAFEACHSGYPYGAPTTASGISPCLYYDWYTNGTGNLTALATDYTDAVAHNNAALSVRWAATQTEGLDVGMTSASNVDTLAVHSSTRTTIDRVNLSTSQVTHPIQSAFSVRMSGDMSNATGDATLATIVFDTVLSNVHNDFNTGTYTYTAPVTGSYHFEVIITDTNSTGHTTTLLRLVTTNNTVERSTGSTDLDDSGNKALVLSATLPMTVGDTAKIQLQVSGGTKTVGVTHGVGGGVWSSVFSGGLVG